MRTSLLTSASFFALSLASPNFKRQDDPDLDAVASTISSIEAEITALPAAVTSQLSLIPSSIIDALSDPTEAANIYSQIAQGQPPDWFSSLPPAIESYWTSVYPKVQTLVSLEASVASVYATATDGDGQVVYTADSADTGTHTSTTAPTSPVSTGASTTSLSRGTGTGSFTTAPPTTGSASGTGSSTKSGSGNGSSTKSGSSTSSSSSGAQPTGVIAAGVFGAVGFLGLALAL